MESEFKIMYPSLEQRKEKHKNITRNHKNRIVVIVDFKHGHKVHIHKLLVPKSMLFGCLHKIMHSHCDKKSAYSSYFLYVKRHIIVPLFETVGSAHKQYGDEDGFLYVTMRQENTFG